MIRSVRISLTLAGLVSLGGCASSQSAAAPASATASASSAVTSSSGGSTSATEAPAATASNATTPATTTPPAATPPEGEFGRVTVDELAGLLERHEAVSIYDNNGHDRYVQGHIPGARWVAYDQVTAQVLPEDRNARLVFYCANEH